MSFALLNQVTTITSAHNQSIIAVFEKQKIKQLSIKQCYLFQKLQFHTLPPHVSFLAMSCFMWMWTFGLELHKVMCLKYVLVFWRSMCNCSKRKWGVTSRFLERATAL